MTVQVAGVDGDSIMAYDVQVIAAFHKLPLPTRVRVAATTLEDIAHRMGTDTLVGGPSGLRDIADELEDEDAETKELRAAVHAAIGHLFIDDDFGKAAVENAVNYIRNLGYRKVDAE